MRGISWLGEDTLAYQRGLCSIQLCQNHTKDTKYTVWAIHRFFTFQQAIHTITITTTPLGSLKLQCSFDWSRSCTGRHEPKIKSLNKTLFRLQVSNFCLNQFSIFGLDGCERKNKHGLIHIHFFTSWRVSANDVGEFYPYSSHSLRNAGIHVHYIHRASDKPILTLHQKMRDAVQKR